MAYKLEKGEISKPPGFNDRQTTRYYTQNQPVHTQTTRFNIPKHPVLYTKAPGSISKAPGTSKA